MTRLLASWFGTGLILRRFRRSDTGSGTVAGAVTLAVILLLRPTAWWIELVAALALIGLSMWAAHPFTVEVPVEDPATTPPDEPVKTKVGDPGWVVIDEAAATVLCVTGLATVPALVAFLVFRVADIAKDAFPGVAAAERLHGGVGVTLDDVVAAGYGAAAGWLVQSLLG